MARQTIKKGNSTITLEINTKQLNAAMKGKIDAILKAIGLKWQSIVTKEITTRRIVDTGRLRASMDFNVISSKKVVEVGSPVKYSIKQEFSNKKGPYLKPSLLNYKDTYKNLAKQILQK